MADLDRCCPRPHHFYWEELTPKYYTTHTRPTTARPPPGMTTTPDHIPIEYQPGSVLRFQIDQDIVTATIVHVFTPFTYSQVAVVRTNHAHTIGQIHLPKDFLLVAKIHDVRFLKERDGIFNKRFEKQVEIPHPWSYELEACAAQNRLNFSYSNSDEYPERPDYDE